MAGFIAGPVQMSLSIGVCFGKMASLHEGLGEYGMQYGEHLARAAPLLAARHGVRLYYRMPQALHGVFGDDVGYLPLYALQRHLSLHARRFDLWHVLHQHNPYRRPWGARRGLATVHDLNYLYGDDERFKTKASRRLARIADAADAFVAISGHTRADLVAALGKAKPVHVIANGVRDLAAVVPQRPRALAPQFEAGRYHFHLSRMAPLKNPDALLALMALLPGEHLVLAGPRNRDSEAVAARAAARGLAKVQVLYDVSITEKAWLLAHCRAFLFPSLAEGFGLPPLEAMQFGRPVFLSTRTSLPEVGGAAASYWPDLDPAAMRDVLLARLAEIDADASAHAERARAWAARFTWPRCIDAHLALYLRLLGLRDGDDGTAPHEGGR